MTISGASCEHLEVLCALPASAQQHGKNPEPATSANL
jgi:hypothetical protein